MRPKRKAPITSYWDRFFLRWVPVSYKKILKKLLHRYPLIPACLLFVFRIPIYLLRFTFCAQSKQKFIILTQGRTGSSLLVDLLNSHPAIHCDPEILNYKTPFLKPFLAAKLTQHRHDVYGFKLKLNQLTDRQNIVNPLEFFSFDKEIKPINPLVTIDFNGLIYILESDSPSNFEIGVYQFIKAPIDK